MQEISSKISNPTSIRNSNMELLRIIAMVLVMIDHAGFMALGVPTAIQTHEVPLLSFLTFSNMAISIVCVDTFVLLSGWFGIKWHISKILQLIFQVLFFSTLVFTITCCLFPQKLLNIKCFSTILLLNGNDYWFIKSYILLFLFSPILNKYIEGSSQKQLRMFLLLFYSVQTIYAWFCIDGARDFIGGYSVLSFIGLYTLARYIRIYESESCFSKLKSIHFLYIFLGIATLQSILAFIVTHIGFPIAGRLFTYTNPVVIIQAMALVMIFAKMKVFHNRIINWISSSCLAVYLLHANELVLRAYYAKFITSLFRNQTLVHAILLTALFIFVVFIISILIDKIRILLWNRIYNK